MWFVRNVDMNGKDKPVIKNNDGAIVLLSGGLDSTVCLYWALNTFKHVYAVTFDYGQSQSYELECSRTICKLANVSQIVLPINTYTALSKLTDESVAKVQQPEHIPPSFVPGRNLVFFTLAAVWGWERGIGNIIAGMTKIDQESYPDTRADTLAVLEKAVCLGFDNGFEFYTPLIHKTKMETIQLAQTLGMVNVLAWTHTCCRKAFPPCCMCPPCLYRQQGFLESGIPDPLLERIKIK